MFGIITIGPTFTLKFPNPFRNASCNPRSYKKEYFSLTIPACSPHPEDNWTRPVMLAHVNPHIPINKKGNYQSTPGDKNKEYCCCLDYVMGAVAQNSCNDMQCGRLQVECLSATCMCTHVQAWTVSVYWATLNASPSHSGTRTQ